jgi:hypothetical protein
VLLADPATTALRGGNALPSVSITATPSLPTTKLALAMSPRLSGDCSS